MSKHEKYVHGRQEGVKTDQGKMEKKGVNRTVPADGEVCDSGSHNKELSNAVHSIYQKAVKNGGGGGDIGDKAIKTR